MFELDSICFGYSKEKNILENISWKPVDQTVSILAGINGCGKSTLLKCLAGLLTPTSGTIRLNGIPLKEIPRHQLAEMIAYLPQNPLIPESFTVTELLNCSRYPYRESNSDTQKFVRQSMEDTGITHLANRQFEQLSGGEKQRVMLAFALVRNAGILLLDEPFSALDPAAFRELFSLLIKLKQSRNLSIITVLHDINRALNYGDRIIGIKNGTLMFDLPPGDAAGKVQELYDLPDSAVFRDKPVFL